MASSALPPLDNASPRPVAARTSQPGAQPEHITRLFPKCRPRQDVNLNPVVGTGGRRSTPREDRRSSHEHRVAATPTTTLDNINSGVFVMDNTANMVVDSSSDRIIEIAGGREVFSQSRAKAGRKGRHGASQQRAVHTRPQKHRNDKDVYDTIYVNEANSNRRRGSCDSNPGSVLISSTRANAPRNISLQSSFPVQHSPPPLPVSTTVTRVLRQAPSPPPLADSPPPPPPHSPPSPHSPPINRRGHKGSPIAVTAGGEVVVFDDIGDDWQGLRLDLENSDNDLDNGIQRTVTVENNTNSLMTIGVHKKKNGGTGKSSPLDDEDIDDDEEEEEESSEEGSCSSEGGGQGRGRGEVILGNEVSGGGRVARVIGELPIAEYAESPRRYGPPRPGFPQRVLSGSSPSPPLVNPPCLAPSSTTFDYLYEFSETRKVLEEFFKCPKPNDIDHDNGTLDDINDFQDLEYELRRHQRRADEDLGVEENGDLGSVTGDGDGDGDDGLDGEGEGADSRSGGSWYVGQRLARPRPGAKTAQDSPHTRHNHTNFLGLQQECDPYEPEVNLVELSVGTGSSGSGSRGGTNGAASGVGGGTGNAGIGNQPSHPPHRFTLSPETTDCDSNCGDLDSEVSLMLMENELGSSNACTTNRVVPCMPVLEDGLSSGHASDADNNNARSVHSATITVHSPLPPAPPPLPHHGDYIDEMNGKLIVENGIKNDVGGLLDSDLNSLDPLASRWSVAPPPPAPEAHRGERGDRVVNNLGGNGVGLTSGAEAPACAAALRDIRLALRRARALPQPAVRPVPDPPTPALWLPRRDTSRESIESTERKPTSGDEDEADTDLETDRLLGQQRTDDQGFYDDKGWRKGVSGNGNGNGNSAAVVSPSTPPLPIPLLPSTSPPPTPPSPPSARNRSQVETETDPPAAIDTNATDANAKHKKDKDGKKKGKNKEVLIEGVLFRARYLGSTQLVCEGQPTKATRMLQAEEAVSRIKAPEGESQPSTEVDLFISTEKIMVLNTDLKEIMMDHALRTISYIADIGDLVVLMARRRFVPHEMDDPPKVNRTPKMICHVFESEEAQFIAQSIGQAFQVAYMEFLKANGIEDHSFVKEMDYQEVLNSQEIFGDELQMFAKKEMQKEVVVPKAKGEILGVVIVESGWGSMLPTVVIANLAPSGAAARCGQLNIGDQIIAINGVSLVGLPLSTCQTYIKNSKNQTVVKLTVVPCAPVVEVKIKRPDTKYQLGFSVQNGVICSLLRGGIAERGGVRVGHRIIEINNQSVVAVPHERIVNLLATSVGEILMKTMPTSMFRLLTGQENPVYI